MGLVITCQNRDWGDSQVVAFLLASQEANHKRVSSKEFAYESILLGDYIFCVPGD